MQKGTDPSKLTPDDLVARWCDWLDFTKTEALEFYTTRRYFENVGALYRSNKPLEECGGDVLSWLADLHKSHFLVCIRRELDQGSGHPTLSNFLHELEAFSEVVLTRARYVALYEDSLLKQYGLPSEHFDFEVGAMCRLPRTDPSNDCISAASIKRTRENLLSKAGRVLKYANWFVLHRTRQKPMDVTWGEVYRVMNDIFDTYRTYYNIITASSYVGRYPTPQFDVMAPFKMAWLTKDFKQWDPPED